MFKTGKIWTTVRCKQQNGDRVRERFGQFRIITDFDGFLEIMLLSMNINEAKI